MGKMKDFNDLCAMSKNEILEFLNEPRAADIKPEDVESFRAQVREGRLATVKPNGSPHIIPIWFEYDGQYVWMSSPRDTSHIENIKRNNKVALVVDERIDTFRHKSVYFEGEAELVDKDILPTTKRIYKRYIGEEGLQHPVAIEFIKMDRYIIKLEPKRIFGWNYNKVMA